MSAKNMIKAAIVGVTVLMVSASASFAADCGCGKCDKGCDCGGSGGCSLPKEAN
jgi:hypothetical protein